MSKNMLRLLKFAIQFRNEDGWHSYGLESARALNALSRLELIDLDREGKRYRLATFQKSVRTISTRHHE